MCMTKPRSIDPTQARHKVQSGEATLVCAYQDEAKCRRLLLDGAITLGRLRASLEQHSKDDELIFYCD